MKLEEIIIEGNLEDKFRITKAIERLPEETIGNVLGEKGKRYLKATIDEKDDSIINLQCLEKKGIINIPERAEMIKQNPESEPGMSFFYIKTFYKILYPK